MNSNQKIIQHVVIQVIGHFAALAIATSNPWLERGYRANKWKWHLTVSLVCLFVSYGISNMPKGLIPLVV